jgi:hypothetical protein
MTEARRLPIVKIHDIDYYKDERLEEYRQVNNPHERISFAEEEAEGNGTAKKD